MLFGLDKSSRAIISANTAIVVEGYMDAISLYSAGFENVVASLGTAFTENQAGLLSRYARRIIFCYDSDEAGQRATVRALPIMKNTGAEVFILIVPDGKDPDEFIRNHGRDAFSDLLKNVLPAIDFLFQYQLNHTDYSTLRGKMQVLQEILPLFLEIKNPVVCEEYFKKFSTVLLLDEFLIRKEWNKISRRPVNVKINNKKLPPSKVSLIRQSGSSIIQTLWHEPELLNYVNALVPTENFIPPHIEIINYIEKCYAEGRTPDALNSARELSPVANLEVSRIIGNEPPENQMSAFHDSVKNMRRVNIERRYKLLEQEINLLTKAGDTETSNKKLQILVNLKKELSEL